MAASEPPPGRDGLLRNRRLLGLLISGGVVILVVASVIGFSGAYFSSTSQSPGNEFAGAEMHLQLDVAGQIVDGDGMLPGDVRTGTQTVNNVGHRGLLVLSEQDLRNTKLSRVLELQVVRTDVEPPVEVYDGPLLGMNSRELGAMAKTEKRVYTFRLTWPEREDSPDLSEATVSFTFDWHLDSLP